MKTYQTEIPTMFGDHHVREVRRILLELPGIDDIYASSSFQFLQLDYDESKVKEDRDHIRSGTGWLLSEIFYLRGRPTWPANETVEPNLFRHTEAFSQTKKVSFHQVEHRLTKAVPCGLALVWVPLTKVEED